MVVRPESLTAAEAEVTRSSGDSVTPRSTCRVTDRLVVECLPRLPGVRKSPTSTERPGEVRGGEGEVKESGERLG